ncbi:polysaccharide deacetylase family protein [Lacticaseibacillus daqingensis]|uniref:polysaccharide deacetylase family protein n=1 Tax=Lacticaseibacillus daqingensis TaxID=2486014 RepID=UPI000F76C055|nr:polysaccharide deacetylase family protein [Lacticaseibacillus daqingensis]
MKKWVLGLIGLLAAVGLIGYGVAAHNQQVARETASHRRAVQAASARQATSKRRAAAKAQAAKAQAAKQAAAKQQAAKQQAAAVTAQPLPQGTNHAATAAAYAHPAQAVHDTMFSRFDPAQPKVVYLTFDDGPNLTMTPKILAVLQAAKVPATFFVIGQQIGASTAPMLRAEYDAGHAIGLHSFTHTYGFEINGDAAATARELNQTLAAVRSVLGPGFATQAWRYPGGHMSWHHLQAPDAVIAQAGMSWIDWNAASGDALGASSPTTVPAMLAYHEQSIHAYGDHNSTVVLMHDAPDKTTTLAALPQIIAYYQQHGYQFGVIE